MRQYFLPFIASKSINQILFIVLFLETVAMTLAIYGAIAAGHSPKAYFEEGGYMSILSCLQLLLGAFLTRKIFLLSKASSNSILNQNSFFFRNLSYGLSFLTFDEAFQIHEYTDKLLHFIFDLLFGFKETKISDLIDDAIVGVYLLVLIVYVVQNWQNLSIFKRSWVYFAIGSMLTILMVFFDAASNNNLFVSILTDNVEQRKSLLIWFGTLEDSLKIYAEGLLIVGIYKCWRIAKSLADIAPVTLKK